MLAFNKKRIQETTYLISYRMVINSKFMDLHSMECLFGSQKSS